MGEPAFPTAQETETLISFAVAVVDSIRNDEEQPQPRYDDGDAMSDETMIAKLSMVVVMLLAELGVAPALRK